MSKRPHHFVLGHDGYSTTRQCVHCGRVQYAYHDSATTCACDLMNQVHPDCPGLWWHPPLPEKCHTQRIHHDA